MSLHDERDGRTHDKWRRDRDDQPRGDRGRCHDDRSNRSIDSHGAANRVTPAPMPAPPAPQVGDDASAISGLSGLSLRSWGGTGGAYVARGLDPAGAPAVARHTAEIRQGGAPGEPWVVDMGTDYSTRPAPSEDVYATVPHDATDHSTAIADAGNATHVAVENRVEHGVFVCLFFRSLT